MPDDAVFQDPDAAPGKKRKRSEMETFAEAANATPDEIEERKQSAKKLGAECPRWMHHRKGEYCKTCGRTS